MQQQALAQTGVDAPKIAGKKGPGSGIAAAFSGAWGRVAVNRQFASGAVEHETNVPRGAKTRKRAYKVKKDRLEQRQGSGTGPAPNDTKRKGEDQEGSKEPR
jgi:hypothetical protein